MARFDAIFQALSAVQTLAAPVLLAKKWRRFRARGDVYEWDLARWRCDFAPPNAPATKNEATDCHLVLVAMGFAETRLAAQLTALLSAARPELRVTWAIRNLAAACEGGATPPHQSTAVLPFDYFWPVAKWIENVEPDAVVFIERFQFPVLARALHNREIKVGAIAARTRDHRGGRYRWGAFYNRWLLGAFDLMCFRSPEEQLKLGDLPASMQRQVTGTLKFWPQLPELEAQRKRDLENWLALAGSRPLVAAGSTQPGDEAWVLDAFAPLREKHDAVLLLAPRHVGRAGEVEKLVQERGWKVARRSNPQKMEAVDVLLLDTLGELTHAYGACRAAFIGGTISGTGHNVLEPIAHGIPVFFGPKRGTFAAEQEMCEAADAGFRVQTPAELSRGFERAVVDEKWRDQIRENARQLNARGALAWSQSVAAILELLEANEAKE